MKIIISCLFVTFLLCTVSAQKNYQKLDSIISNDIIIQGEDPFPSTKISYAYDENNNPDTTVLYTYNDQTLAWDEYVKIDADHNLNGDISLIVSYVWDYLFGIWERSDKFNKYYDGNHNFVRLEEFVWNDTTYQWMPTAKLHNSYDGNDSLVLAISEHWNRIDNRWENNTKISAFYGGNGKRLLTTIYKYDGGWNEYSKDQYDYNSDDNLVQKTTYLWSEISNEWIYNERTKNTYDNNENVEKIVDLAWSQQDNKWVNEYQQEFIFNPISQLVDTFILSEWGAFDNKWINELRVDYSFDAQERTKELILFFWDEVDTIWMPIQKLELDYPYIVPISNLILPYELEVGPFLDQRKVKDVAAVQNYLWDEVSNTWALSGTIGKFYSEIITSIAENHLIKAKIFPNPAHAEINIESEYDMNGLDFQFYDMTGKLMFKTIGRDRIQIPQMVPGGYILRVMDGAERILVEKIIIN